MSETIRYEFIYNENFCSVEREEHPEGDYVTYEDYARLKAQVERLTAFTTRTIIPNEELQAQVERLTKAGDAMWNALLCSGCSECEGMYDCHDESMELWNAAKEGKQSK